MRRLQSYVSGWTNRNRSSRCNPRGLAGSAANPAELSPVTSGLTCALGHGLTHFSGPFSHMLRLLSVSRRLAWLLLSSVVLIAAPLQAQYFGRNKVQYQNFDFQVLKTEHFDIYYYPAEQVAAESGGPDGRAMVRALSHRARSRAVGPAAADPLRQPRRNSSRPTPSGATSARAPAVSPRHCGGGSCCRWAAPLGDLDHVIGHELVHAFQYDITGSGGPTALGALPGAPRHSRSGSSRAWLNTCPSARSTPRPPCGCGARCRTPPGTRCPHSGSSTIRATSPTATVRRCWPTWRGTGATRPSGELLRQAAGARGVDQAIRRVLHSAPTSWLPAGTRRPHAGLSSPSLAETRPAESYGPSIVGSRRDDQSRVQHCALAESGRRAR